MATVIDDQGNIVIDNEIVEYENLTECIDHQFEFKKQYKECLICNKQENYIDDPLETHIHNFAEGLILNKPNLSVCTLCGETKFEFNCKDAGDEGFFQFTSDYTNILTKTDDIPKLPKFKNKLPRKELIDETLKVPNNTPEDFIPVGKRFLDWQRDNTEKLSFIRK